MVEHLPDLVVAARQFWRGLIPGAFERRLVLTLIIGVFYFLVIFLIERTSGARTDGYRSRGFAHDIAYYFFYRSGLQSVLVPAAIVTVLHGCLSFLDLRLLVGLPYWLQVVVWLPIFDFVGYWLHRAYHGFGLLWAFHTTHHAQEDLTFASYTRVHPVEDAVGNLVGMILLLMLGASPRSSIMVSLVLNLVGHLQHTHVPWRFGPTDRLFVTPPYHLYHHSADPLHHNKNFAIVFSFWDRLFGTAVKESSPTPTRFGLVDVRPTSLWGTLVAPCHQLGRLYGPACRRALAALSNVGRPVRTSLRGR